MRAWMRPLIAAIAIVALVAAGAPAAAQPTSSSYESPTYGFEVSWDPEVWTPDERATLVAAGAEAMDQLRLMHTAGATLHVVAGRFGYADAQACVAAESDLLASENGVSDYGPVILNDGQEMIGSEDGIAFGGFQLTFTPATGEEPLNMVNFIECRLLPDSDAALVFVLITTPDSFEQHMIEAGAVNASLRLAQPDDANAGTSTDEADAGASPVADVDVPVVDDAWFDEQVAAATANDSLFGPESGQLIQTEGQTALASTGVDAANFYLRVRVQAPTDPEDTGWDFGVAFREQNSGEHYRLVFDSSSVWYLSLGVESDIETGTANALATGPGAVNTLELVVAGDTGAYRLNGELVGPLDLSALTGPGEIALGTAFFAANTTVDQAVTYRDLQVWPLEVETPVATSTPDVTPVATAEPVTPVPTEEPAPTPEATTEATVGPLYAIDIGWRLGDLSTLAGDPITLTVSPGTTFDVISEGAADHSFVIDELGIEVPIAPGETVQVTIPEDAAPGEYRFYCNVPGHSAAGMVGVLIVEDAGTTTTEVETPQPEPTVTPEPTATEVPPTAPAETPVSTAAPSQQVVVRLSPVSDSGVEGLAVLYPVEGNTTVALTMLGASGDQIGAIHTGTCAAFDPLPAYALAGFDPAGRSSSPIGLGFDELGAEPLAIVIHASAADFSTVLACGDITP